MQQRAEGDLEALPQRLAQAQVLLMKKEGLVEFQEGLNDHSRGRGKRDPHHLTGVLPQLLQLRFGGRAGARFDGAVGLVNCTFKIFL